MSASGLPALAAACLGVLLSAPFGAAAAAPKGVPGQSPPRRVLLLAFSAAEEHALDGVKLDLRELVEPVSLRALPAERSDRRSLLQAAERYHALAAIWLDQSSAGQIVVYVFDPQSRRLGMRRLPRAGQANAEESVGVVLRATLEALLEGREAPLEAVPLPAEPAAPPPTPPAALPRPRASLRTGYLGVGFGRDSIEHGASLGATLALSRLMSVGANYAILQPAELTLNRATVTLKRHPFEAFASLGLFLGALELRGDAGASLDFRQRRSAVTDATLSPSSAASYTVVSMLARLSLASELWPGLRLDFGPAFEVPFNEPALVVARSDSDESLSSWKIRPRLEAGISLVIR